MESFNKEPDLIGGMDKTSILVEDLRSIIQYIIKGDVSITFHSLHKSNGNMWAIQSPKKNLVVMLHYKDEPVFIKQKPNKMDYHAEGTALHIQLRDCPSLSTFVTNKSVSTDSTYHLDKVSTLQSDKYDQTPCEGVGATVEVHNSFENAENDHTYAQHHGSNSVSEEVVSPTMAHSCLADVSTISCNVEHNKHVDQHVTKCTDEMGVTQTLLILPGTEPIVDISNLNFVIPSSDVSITPQLLDKNLPIKKSSKQRNSNVSPRHRKDTTILAPLNLNVFNKVESNNSSNFLLLLKPLQSSNNNISVTSQKQQPCLLETQVLLNEKVNSNIECSCCGKMFEITADLKTQLQAEKNTYVCPECNSLAQHASNLNSESNDQPQENNPFYCSICKKTLPDLHHFNSHLKNKHFKCLLCNKRSQSMYHLKLHQQVVHMGIKPFKCLQCDKRFYKKGDLKRHNKLHTGETPYECSYCSRKFIHKNSFKQHELIHTGEKPYMCSHCGWQFAQRSSLSTHMLKHTGEKRFLCSHCGKRFALKYKFTQHMNIHSGLQPYQCSQCERKFNNRGNLERHKLIHTGEKPYQCLQCNKKFRQKGSLDNHTLVHSGEKPYECTQCGKKFRNKYFLLNNHMFSHSGKKPYECFRCEKKFYSEHYLQRHILDHELSKRKTSSSEKSHECSECGKKFRCKSLLNQHQVVHTGNKPFECSQCGKKFLFKSTLNTHSRVHSGLKPYQCSQCGKKFNSSSNFHRHKLIHTGMKPYECLECGQKFHQKSQLQYHNKVRSGKNHLNFLRCKKKNNIEMDEIVLSSDGPSANYNCKTDIDTL